MPAAGTDKALPWNRMKNPGRFSAGGNEKPRAVYAYCTSHGLQMARVNTANFVSGKLIVSEGGLSGTDVSPYR